MKFRQFLEIAFATDFSLVLQKIDRYVAALKKEDPDIDHPLYSLTKRKITYFDVVKMEYWDALQTLRAVVSQHVHDKNILKVFEPVYKQIRYKMDEREKDENYSPVVSRLRMTTNLYLIYEAIQDILKGQTPEPD